MALLYLALRSSLRVSRGLEPMLERLQTLGGTVASFKPQIEREMRRVAGSLRNQVPFQSLRMNVAATAKATLQAGEAFGPVFFTGRRERKFAFLVERKNLQDHQALIGLRVADQCRQMGAEVAIYTFVGDIQVLELVRSSSTRGHGPDAHFIRLEALLGGCRNTEFIFVCDPTVLVPSVRSTLSRWLERIQAESAGVAVLTMSPRGQTIRSLRRSIQRLRVSLQCW